MLKATWMMKFLKSRNLEVIQTSKVVWRNLKEDFDPSRRGTGLSDILLFKIFWRGPATNK